MTSDKLQVGHFSKKVMKYCTIYEGRMFILARMLILSEYSNDKKTFYTIYEHHCLVRNYKRAGLCPTVNENISVSLTVLRKKE